jgi:ABC-type lipoprotein export system ATPase subunit
MPMIAPLTELLHGLGATTRELTSTHAIVLENLAKTYADGTEAVRGISLSVAPGEAYGLLGPNGAGKSTTLGMIGTLIVPTGGMARVAGLDVVADRRGVRGRVGFAMQQAGLDEFATPLELLVLQGRLHGIPKAEAVRRARLLLLRRNEAPRRPRLGADPPAGDRPPRRADGGPRPTQPSGDLGHA